MWWVWRMKVEGSHSFDAPRDVVWPMLRDPEVLAQILPGCEQLSQVGVDQYEGTLKIKIGLVQGTFDGSVTLSEIHEPESASITVTGKGAPGFMNGTGRLRLEEDGEQSILHYEGDAQIGGRLAAVGQRLLDSSTKAIIRSGLEGLDAQVRAASRPVSADGTRAGEASTPIVPPSQSAFARGVLRHMVRDALDDTDRKRLIRAVVWAAGVALVVYVLYRWIR